MIDKVQQKQDRITAHEKFLRLHCEAPTSAAEIAQRTGKRLNDVVAWYHRPQTLRDLAAFKSAWT